MKPNKTLVLRVRNDAVRYWHLTLLFSVFTLRQFTATSLKLVLTALKDGLSLLFHTITTFYFHIRSF